MKSIIPKPKKYKTDFKVVIYLIVLLVAIIALMFNFTKAVSGKELDNNFLPNIFTTVVDKLKSVAKNLQIQDQKPDNNNFQIKKSVEISKTPKPTNLATPLPSPTLTPTPIVKHIKKPVYRYVPPATPAPIIYKNSQSDYQQLQLDMQKRMDEFAKKAREESLRKQQQSQQDLENFRKQSQQKMQEFDQQAQQGLEDFRTQNSIN